jgi:hypothetical protein
MIAARHAKARSFCFALESPFVAETLRSFLRVVMQILQCKIMLQRIYFDCQNKSATDNQ